MIEVSRRNASLRLSNTPGIPQPLLFDPCGPLSEPAWPATTLSSVPALCSLELRRTLRTVRAALEAFDVVGGVRIVLLAPALDDQLIASATAEWARHGLGGILDRIAIHVGEVVSIDGAHGCTFRRSR